MEEKERGASETRPGLDLDSEVPRAREKCSSALEGDSYLTFLHFTTDTRIKQPGHFRDDARARALKVMRRRHR